MPEDPSALWRTYADHAELMFRGYPGAHRVDGQGWSLVVSGAAHVDTNQLALYAPAGAGDIEAALAATKAAGVPVLTGLSGSLADRGSAAGRLMAAGFEAMPDAEMLFVAGGAPPVDATWPVRRATPDDLPAVREVFDLGHGYGPAVVDSMFGSRLADLDVGCWIAWDGPAPMSLAFVTRTGSSLGLWEVVTVPAHRRRGAARAVVTSALGDASRWGPGPVDTVVFWSSPAGRPLYEHLGFRVADEVVVLTLGAAPEDLAAVGAG